MRWEEPHHPGPGLQLERHSTPLLPTLQHDPTTGPQRKPPCTAAGPPEQGVWRRGGLSAIWTYKPPRTPSQKPLSRTSALAIRPAAIISRTEGTRTRATTSWIFGAARAARSSTARRWSRRRARRLAAQLVGERRAEAARALDRGAEGRDLAARARARAAIAAPPGAAARRRVSATVIRSSSASGPLAGPGDLGEAGRGAAARGGADREQVEGVGQRAEQPAAPAARLALEQRVGDDEAGRRHPDRDQQRDAARRRRARRPAPRARRPRRPASPAAPPPSGRRQSRPARRRRPGRPSRSAAASSLAPLTRPPARGGGSRRSRPSCRARGEREQQRRGRRAEHLGEEAGLEQLGEEGAAARHRDDEQAGEARLRGRRAARPRRPGRAPPPPRRSGAAGRRGRRPPAAG